ncbi:Pathogenesis-related thaumatin-like protein 3.5 [Linum grandiflorum]
MQTNSKTSNEIYSWYPFVSSMNWNTYLTIVLFVFVASFRCYPCAFTVTNNCLHPIWPGTLAGSGTPQLVTTGFRLESGQTARIPTVPGWSGRIWARTGCLFDESGVGSCQTGDCGGKLHCSGSGATPPASLFEITFAKGADDKDFYDVSIVDGYNLPLVASPTGAQGACNATGCVYDLNLGCPKELQVVGQGTEGIDGGGGVIGCKSACEAFGLEQYCCSGQYANPTTCRPSFYSSIFKQACPTAYSYAFDDGTSTFTCKSSDYSIIFCPSNNTNNNNNNYNNPDPTTGATSSDRCAVPVTMKNSKGEAEGIVSASNEIRHLHISVLHMLIIGIFVLIMQS